MASKKRKPKKPRASDRETKLTELLELASAMLRLWRESLDRDQDHVIYNAVNVVVGRIDRALEVEP